MYYFSAQTQGFYHKGLHGDAIPQDAVALTDAQYDAVMNECPVGTYITVGPDGYPVRQPCTPPPPQQTERHWRDGQINQVQWLRDRHRDELELGRPPTLDAKQFEQLLQYLQALREWPQAESFPAPAHRPAPQPWLLALTTLNQPL